MSWGRRSEEGTACPVSSSSRAKDASRATDEVGWRAEPYAGGARDRALRGERWARGVESWSRWESSHARCADAGWGTRDSNRRGDPSSISGGPMVGVALDQAPPSAQERGVAHRSAEPRRGANHRAPRASDGRNGSQCALPRRFDASSRQQEIAAAAGGSVAPSQAGRSGLEARFAGSWPGLRHRDKSGAKRWEASAGAARPGRVSMVGSAGVGCRRSGGRLGQRGGGAICERRGRSVGPRGSIRVSDGWVQAGAISDR